MILNNRTKSNKDLITEKNDLDDSIPIDKNKIRESIDIDMKLKNYNKNLNYNSFNELKKLEEENQKNNKNKKILKDEEKNNSLNYSNDESVSGDKGPLDSQSSQHRKYSLEKRIRDFKKKIKNDLNLNMQLNNMKPIESKIKFCFF